MTAPRRTRGMSAGLTRDVVIAAAEAVAEREGFEGTTIRAVAAELDVTAGALYNHVSGKDELVDAVADAFIARVLKRRLPAEPLARAKELARRLHKAGLEHPGLLIGIVGHIPDQIPSAQMLYTETFLEALVAAGATEEQAHLLYRLAICVVLTGSVAQVNLLAPGKLPLKQRMASHMADPDMPYTSRYLASGNAMGNTRDFDQQVDFLLRDLSG